MMSPFPSLPTWPDTNTKPPAFVASERGSVRVLALLSSKNSIVIFDTFREEGLIDSATGLFTPTGSLGRHGVRVERRFGRYSQLGNALHLVIGCGNTSGLSRTKIVTSS